MAFCLARNCRSTGLESLTGLCLKHFNFAVEHYAKEPVTFAKQGSYSACYVCGKQVSFKRGLYAQHLDVDGLPCTTSGHEIAILRAQ